MDRQGFPSQTHTALIHSVAQQLRADFGDSPYAHEGTPNFDIIMRMKRGDLQNWLRCRLNGVDPFLSAQEDVDVGITRIDIFRYLLRELPLDWQNLMCSIVSDELSELYPGSQSPYWLTPGATLRLLQLTSFFTPLAAGRYCAVQLVHLVEAWIFADRPSGSPDLLSQWHSVTSESLWRAALISLFNLGFVVHDPADFWPKQLTAALAISGRCSRDPLDVLNSIGGRILLGWSSLGVLTLCQDLDSLLEQNRPERKIFRSHALGRAFGAIVTKRVSEHTHDASADRNIAIFLQRLRVVKRPHFHPFFEGALSELPRSWRLQERLRTSSAPPPTATSNKAQSLDDPALQRIPSPQLMTSEPST